MKDLETPCDFEGHRLSARPDYSRATLPAAGGQSAITTTQYYIFKIELDMNKRGRVGALPRPVEQPWSGTPPTMLDLKMRLEEWAASVIAEHGGKRGNV